MKVKKSASERKRIIHDKVASTLFLSPSIIGVLIFFILPFFIVIYYSMVDNPINNNFVFFENFISVFKNSAFQTAAKNTLVFSCVAVPLAVVLSMLLAFMLDSKIPGRSKFRTFFLSPMMVPVASVVLIWQVLFHYNGALNEFISMFGLQPVDWMKSQFSQIVVVILFLWKNLGYNMILFLSAINNIPGELLEVATVEGAGSFAKFWHIKLKYLSPTVLFVTVLSLINSFKVFREVYLLTGDYPYGGLYMLQHFMNNTFKTLDYQKLSAAAIIMAIVMVLIIGILFKVEDRYGKDVED